MTQSRPATSAPTADISNQRNWGGAHWNPDTRLLWLCNDGGEVRANEHGAGGWSAALDLPADGDLETISQRLDNTVLLSLSQASSALLLAASPRRGVSSPVMIRLLVVLLGSVAAARKS